MRPSVRLAIFLATVISPVWAAEGLQGNATEPAASAKAAPAVIALTDTGWPRQIVYGKTTVTIYQPQLDAWDGYHFSGRAAFAVQQQPDDPSPVYGIVEFVAQTHVDKQARLAVLEQFKVTKAIFPNDDERSRAWVSMIEARAAKVRPIALDRLEAALAVTEAGRRANSMPLKNDPPLIVFSDTPAILIPIDGEPVYRDVSGTSLQRVLNTRPLILRDKSGKLYLKIFDGWMTAPSRQGPWTVGTKVPGDCNKALKAAVDGKTADLLVGGDPKNPSSSPSLKKGPAPRVLVETQPAELIVTEGSATYKGIEGTSLLYVQNTTGNVFLDTKTQRGYVLVSGRWFTGPSSLQGPWAFVTGEGLPEDFAKIPDTSPKENVKASIPGTPQAQEATVANSIPQTAKVKRSDAHFAPSFDGPPKAEPIEGTALHYIANSSSPIVVVDSTAEYFGVQNGVWFVTKSLGGPWLAATTVPAAIYSIPPGSPLHYVTYVRVYDATPEYVIVGYTPGYYGAYVSGGCVVYGTGYSYAPWVGTYWFGAPVTYGFGTAIVYTPWAGWQVAYGLGWTWGVATTAIGWGWGPYPWWGPAGWGWAAAYPWVYRPGYGVAWGPRGAVAWGPGYWAGTTGNVYSRWGSTTAVTRASGGYDAWTGNRWAGRSGMSYNSRTGTLAAGQRAAVGNVYTGNYAGGSRNAAYNARTGVSATGGKVTAGNAYTGRQVTAGRETVTGPGGQSTTISGVKGDQAGVIKGQNNTYAGYDGNVYRHQEGGGWEKHTGNGWEPTNLAGSNRLDGQRNARAAGETRWNNYNSGGYRTAGGARGAHGGSRRRD